MEEYYAENPDKKPVEMMKEKVAGGGTKKKKGFQADTDAETAFDSEFSWMEEGFCWISQWCCQGRRWKTTQVQDFHRGNRSEKMFDCGGVTAPRWHTLFARVLL